MNLRENYGKYPRRGNNKLSTVKPKQAIKDERGEK